MAAKMQKRVFFPETKSLPIVGRAWSCRFLILVFSLLMWVFVAMPAKASSLSELADSLAPGAWKQLPATFLPDSRHFWRHRKNFGTDIAEFANSGAWDPVGGRVFFIGSGHGSSVKIKTKLVQYDEALDEWSVSEAISERVPQQVAGIGHEYDHVTIDPVRRLLYVAEYFTRSVHELNLKTMSWRELPTLPRAGITKGVEYVNELDSVIVVDPVIRVIYALKHGAPEWVVLRSKIYEANYHPVAERDPIRGGVYFGGGNNAPRAFYRLNVDGSVDRLAEPPLNIDLGQTGGDNVCDPVSGHFLIRLHRTGEMAEYLPALNEWRRVETDVPKALIGSQSTFAVPISTYGVIMYVVVREGSASVWLYRHKVQTH